MTVQAPPSPRSGPVDAGRQVEQLRHILGLVEQIAGPNAPMAAEAAIDENARISSAYQQAAPIVRRRFDALTVETAAWAAAGIQALLVARAGAEPPRAAAAGLAYELDGALRRLNRLVGP